MSTLLSKANPSTRAFDSTSSHLLKAITPEFLCVFYFCWINSIQSCTDFSYHKQQTAAITTTLDPTSLSTYHSLLCSLFSRTSQKSCLFCLQLSFHYLLNLLDFRFVLPSLTQSFFSGSPVTSVLLNLVVIFRCSSSLIYQ